VIAQIQNLPLMTCSHSVKLMFDIRKIFHYNTQQIFLNNLKDTK
jgi:hypothetical protein